jgi:hypothetical protein
VVEATRTLIGGDHPTASWVGIGLAAFTAPTMPPFARAKRRVGHQLSSAEQALSACLKPLYPMGWRDRDYAKWTDEERGRFLSSSASGVRSPRLGGSA